MCVAGRVPAEKFRGKFVLIGATAASLGDRVASPFVRYTDARADQHGALMPGVEVLANAIHVILSSRYYTEPSDTGGVSVGRHGRAADPAAARMGAGRPRISEATRRAGGNGGAGDAGELPGVSQAADLPAHGGVPGGLRLRGPARSLAAIAGGLRAPGRQHRGTGALGRPAGARRPRHSRSLPLGGRRSGLAVARLASQGAWNGRRGF